jgi:hypothetical protein
MLVGFYWLGSGDFSNAELIDCEGPSEWVMTSMAKNAMLRYALYNYESCFQ